MMMAMADALTVIRTKDRLKRPVPFDLEYVSANRKTGEGGILHSLQNMVYVWPRNPKNQDVNPNHVLNGTIDIQPAGGGEITRLHLFLIRTINGKILT